MASQGFSESNLFSIIFLLVAVGYSAQENIFRIIKTDYHLQSFHIISNHTAVSDLTCALLCNRKKNCVGFNYRPKTNKNTINCQLSNCAIKTRFDDKTSADSFWKYFQTQYISSYGSKENPGNSCADILKQRCSDDGIYWIILGTNVQQLFPVYCDMTNGGWTLVFKTIAGESGVVSTVWRDPLSPSENSFEALNKNNSFKHHYKNRIVQNWEIFNPNEVRVVLYTQSKEQLVLNFNAVASNYMNWFSENRLQQSPWQDVLTTNKNFFSIDGSSHRCFFINHRYGGCHVDGGWLMIGGSICAWENRFQGNSFQYSKTGNWVVWSEYGNVATAEVFAVYLR